MANSTPKTSDTEVESLIVTIGNSDYSMAVYGTSVEYGDWIHTYSEETIQDLLDKIHKLLKERKKKC